jgi:calcineurin-like phosphoesterase family protein
MIYFTADTHFGHENVIKHSGRPFDSADEMDKYLIDSWNKRVQDTDTVYVLGDVIFRSKKHPGAYLDVLKGTKHLILGNHDRKWIKGVNVNTYFESVSHMKVISDGSHSMTLCHYPTMSWSGQYMIYGHIHNNTHDEYWPLLKTMDKALNAGVDINNYVPVTFDELVVNNRIFKESLGGVT